MKAGQTIVFKGVEAIAVQDENDSCKDCVFFNILICPSPILVGLNCMDDEIIFKKLDSVD